jgi:hypothetical protein
MSAESTSSCHHVSRFATLELDQSSPLMRESSRVVVLLDAVNWRSLLVLMFNLSSDHKLPLGNI